MEIKPIETVYKGYRFRSRLEARWAVFFDALGIKWEYEPEGFDLGDGIYYLPDFKIHGVSWRETREPVKNFYVEIKGVNSDEEISKKDKEKILRFSPCEPYFPSNDRAFIVLGNLPDNSITYYSQGWILFSHELTDGDSYPGFFVVSYDENNNDKHIRFTGTDHNIEEYCEDRHDDYSVVDEALRIARQARFEHGENPETFMDEYNPESTDFKVFLANMRAKYNLEDTAEYLKYFNAVSKGLLKLTPVEYELYIEKISREDNIAEKTLRTMCGETPSPKQCENKRRVGYLSEDDIRKIKKLEEEHIKRKLELELEILHSKTIICLSIKSKECFDKFVGYDDSNKINFEPEYREIFEELKFMHSKGLEVNGDSVHNHFDELCQHDLMRITDECLDEIKIGNDEKKTFDEMIKKLDKSRKEKRKQELKDMLDMAPDDADPQFLDKLLKEYLELQK